MQAGGGKRRSEDNDPADSQEHFYTEMVDALRIHGADAQPDIEELWRRMAYFVLITNVDDHLHNHGLPLCVRTKAAAASLLANQKA